MPFHLVPNQMSPGLLAACEDLTDGAKSGQIIGLGVVVMLRRNRFFVDVFGEMTRNPHAARGFVASLDDCLREIGRQKRDTNTTI